MKWLIVVGVVLIIMALLMPWCSGYLEEAGRFIMAARAVDFGLASGFLGSILFFTGFIGSID